MSSLEACALCVGNPLDSPKSTSWIQCDVCKKWYHAICTKLTQPEIKNLNTYHCQVCSAKHGESSFRRKLKRARVQIDYVALNEGETFAIDKANHHHVYNFLNFEPDATSEEKTPYIEVLESEQLNKEYVLRTELPKPVLIPQVDLKKSGMKLPARREEISVQYIEDKVGGDTPVEVMDVLTQQGVLPGWNMSKWKEYFYTDAESRDRIRNVISLEVSQVDDIGKAFSRPNVVKDLDLVDKVWSYGEKNQPRPQVTKYCLMSVKSSYTDFHLDFSGTCVYYTVCKGKKTFLMYPPTDLNLYLYTAWCQEPHQNFTWFGDYTKSYKGRQSKPAGGFKATLKEGDLFIIPSGWIHAVYTPEDSVVIGGNFLLLNSLEMHLKINDIEKKTRVPSKFRFPMFNKVLWLTSWYYFNNQDAFIEDIESTPIKQENDIPEIHHPKAYNILNKLIDQLSDHLELSKTNAAAKRSVPTNLIGKNVPEYLSKLTEWCKLLS